MLNCTTVQLRKRSLINILILSYRKEKILDQQIYLFSRIGKTMEKLQFKKFKNINFKYYGKHQPLRKKCPYSELLWSAFSRIRTECGEILRISPYSVRMRENADQNNSEYGHFLRSESACNISVMFIYLMTSN